MSDNNTATLRDFQEVTGLPEDQAKALLEASGWNVELATELFYQEHDMDTNSHDEEDEPSRPSTSGGDGPSDDLPESQAAGPKKGSGKVNPGSSRFATFSDIRKKEESDDEDDPRKQKMFAGGEKSGIAVQNNEDPIGRIFKKAAQPSSWSDDEEESKPKAPASRFTGSGRVLGAESGPSAPAPAQAPARQPRPEDEIVHRELIFWKDGFSVDDGPLLRYDDPANAEVLKLIESGRAPAHLLNVKYGQRAEVSLKKRMDENYTPPKKVWKPFEGQGNRLGSPSPSVASSAFPPPAASAAPAAASSSAPPDVKVDDAAPTTTLQIRLGDGTRLRSRFNHTHTVGDLYAFVNAASRESTQRAYVLQTAFPAVKDLTDKEKTLKEEGLLQSQVIQKWLK